jgi:mannose-1-phosphate guanylyltransferase/mannose-6-phosphate isomerase
MSARTLLAEAALHAPQLFAAVEASVNTGRSVQGTLALSADAWAEIDGQAIDTAIMEKSRNLQVIKVSAGWSDLGDWNAIWRESQKDQNGLVTTGKSVGIDCRNSLLRSSDRDGPQLVGIGLTDMVAVATRDSVLVTSRERAQDVRMAASLGLADFGALQCPHVDKPWGSFDILGGGLRYQVKRLTVKPGGQLSLQSHRFRAEHWVVVQGKALVTRGDDVQEIETSGSVYVEKGQVHRLENRTDQALVLIEVQIGAHIAEDDIKRYADAYGRA